MLTGSLGMLPSASLGKMNAMFEPVHGSAPDIANQGKANPLAMILSLAMAFRYALDMPQWADIVEQAVTKTVDAGRKTADIARHDDIILSTSAMGDEIIATMEAITS